jgi:hypothetical protein
MRIFVIIFTLTITSLISLSAQVLPSADKNIPSLNWKNISSETKPWTRWWWHGSALTKDGITLEMEAFHKAGLGGVEITPIYGVFGYEDKFVNYLSPAWIDLLMHTLKEGERLGLGVDMATGTGWPFGGPWVSADDACKNIYHKIYELEGGQRLREKVEFIQPAYLSAIGTQMLNRSQSRNDTIRYRNFHKPGIKDLIEPVSANRDLQSLALDQVQFEKSLPLQALIAYGNTNEVIDLTRKVDDRKMLNWTAPPGKWKLYALFQGWHGKMVERAGPGGEGNVIDHFSANALKNYLNKFDSAFDKADISPLRAFFNDSYEVDDARGAADWTPALLDEFKKRRGYDLRDHLPALLANDEKAKNERVLCDYRETVSELLMENFTMGWKNWANEKKALTRNQAHGSPANILDLYSVVDIPEIEGTEPLRIKMASSAANVSGKKLTSAEAATWLNEHFHSNLADIKIALDRFMLNGVNHLVYHGTAYSPADEPWPGWLFYAAVHLNPRNPLWNDFHILNKYVTRCQSLLQNSLPDNDVLLYYPVYDRFSTPGQERIEHFDGIGKQFEGSSFARCAQTMLEAGYTFDYISDKQIQQLTFSDSAVVTQGHSSYKTIVIPHCQYIPIKTLEKIYLLLREGAQVIFFEGMPESFAGYGDFEKKTTEFHKLLERISHSGQQGEKGKMISGTNLKQLLPETRCRRESMVEQGVVFIRKKNKDGTFLYLINNQNDSTFTGWITLATRDKFIHVYDPMTGASGQALTEISENKYGKVYVQLSANQSLILMGSQQNVSGNLYPFYDVRDKPVAVSGKWQIQFTSGGPEIPPTIETDTLTSWTNFPGNNYKSFSGAAVYTLTFRHKASQAKDWLLDLGEVNETAEITINGKHVGTLICPSYAIVIPASLLKKKNTLEVRVSNLMINRIADLDRRKIVWKKFYNVNFPARLAENRKNNLFDAAAIAPSSSGLLGPVTLTPVQKITIGSPGN